MHDTFVTGISVRYLYPYNKKNQSHAKIKKKKKRTLKFKFIIKLDLLFLLRNHDLIPTRLPTKWTLSTAAVSGEEGGGGEEGKNRAKEFSELVAAELHETLLIGRSCANFPRRRFATKNR